jgi:hypothetical protein
MRGYKYNSETEAIAARQTAADYMGLPAPNGKTLYWVSFNYSELDGFYYIQYVDGLEAALGEPTDITVGDLSSYTAY